MGEYIKMKVKVTSGSVDIMLRVSSKRSSPISGGK